MIYISHRGNLNGPQLDLENTPEYIDAAIWDGFDVEIDVWYQESDGLMLGHDSPETPIKLDWLLERKNNLWVHCKNHLSLDLCLNTDLHCFYHTYEDWVLTSKNYVWAYPGKKALPLSKCINVCPEKYESHLSAIEVIRNFSGVCSDYIEEIKECLKK